MPGSPRRRRGKAVRIERKNRNDLILREAARAALEETTDQSRGPLGEIRIFFRAALEGATTLDPLETGNGSRTGQGGEAHHEIFGELSEQDLCMWLFFPFISLAVSVPRVLEYGVPKYAPSYVLDVANNLTAPAGDSGVDGICSFATLLNESFWAAACTPFKADRWFNSNCSRAIEYTRCMHNGSSSFDRAFQCEVTRNGTVMRLKTVNADEAFTAVIVAWAMMVGITLLLFLAVGACWLRNIDVCFASQERQRTTVGLVFTCIAGLLAGCEIFSSFATMFDSTLLLIFIYLFFFCRLPTSLATFWCTVAMAVYIGVGALHLLRPPTTVCHGYTYARCEIFGAGKMGVAGFLMGCLGHYTHTVKRRSDRVESRLREKLSYVHRATAHNHLLLAQILPEELIGDIYRTGSTIAKQFDSVSMCFAFIIGVEDLPTSQQQYHLNNLFKKFDRLSTAHNVEKIKTIGADYMVGSGLPRENPLHAQNLCGFALAVVEEIKAYNAAHVAGGRVALHGGKSLAHPFEYKIGIASGPVVGGIIGSTKFTYDVFGNTVNTASRMMSHAPQNTIHMTDKTADLLRATRQERGSWLIDPHPEGMIRVKGKGLMMTNILRGYVHPGSSDDDDGLLDSDRLRRRLPYHEDRSSNSSRTSSMSTSTSQHGQRGQHGHHGLKHRVSSTPHPGMFSAPFMPPSSLDSTLDSSTSSRLPAFMAEAATSGEWALGVPKRTLGHKESVVLGGADIFDFNNRRKSGAVRASIFASASNSTSTSSTGGNTPGGAGQRAPGGATIRVRYSHAASQADELTVHEGDWLEVLGTGDNRGRGPTPTGWVWAKNLSSVAKKVGLVPISTLPEDSPGHGGCGLTRTIVGKGGKRRKKSSLWRESIRGSINSVVSLVTLGFLKKRSFESTDSRFGGSRSGSDKSLPGTAGGAIADADANANATGGGGGGDGTGGRPRVGSGLGLQAIRVKKGPSLDYPNRQMTPSIGFAASPRLGVLDELYSAQARNSLKMKRSSATRKRIRKSKSILANRNGARVGGGGGSGRDVKAMSLGGPSTPDLPTERGPAPRPPALTRASRESTGEHSVHTFPDLPKQLQGYNSEDSVNINMAAQRALMGSRRRDSTRASEDSPRLELREVRRGGDGDETKTGRRRVAYADSTKEGSPTGMSTAAAQAAAAAAASPFVASQQWRRSVVEDEDGGEDMEGAADLRATFVAPYSSACFRVALCWRALPGISALYGCFHCCRRRSCCCCCCRMSCRAMGTSAREAKVRHAYMKLETRFRLLTSEKKRGAVLLIWLLYLGLVLYCNDRSAFGTLNLATVTFHRTSFLRDLAAAEERQGHWWSQPGPVRETFLANNASASLLIFILSHGHVLNELLIIAFIALLASPVKRLKPKRYLHAGGVNMDMDESATGGSGRKLAAARRRANSTLASRRRASQHARAVSAARARALTAASPGKGKGGLQEMQRKNSSSLHRIALEDATQAVGEDAADNFVGRVLHALVFRGRLLVYWTRTHGLPFMSLAIFVLIGAITILQCVAERPEFGYLYTYLLMLMLTFLNILAMIPHADKTAATVALHLIYLTVMSIVGTVQSELPSELFFLRWFYVYLALMVPTSLVCVMSDYFTEAHHRMNFLQEIHLQVLLEAENGIRGMTETLLHKTPLPPQILDDLLAGRSSQRTETYATILYADIKSFTVFSETVTALHLVKILNAMFIKFDAIAKTYGVNKVKTIGDCFVGSTGIFDDDDGAHDDLAVGGRRDSALGSSSSLALDPLMMGGRRPGSQRNPNQALAMIGFGLKMHSAMEELSSEFALNDLPEACGGTSGLSIRVGIHSGPVIGGIIGVKKLQFDLWGRTMEIAEEMESRGVPRRVHISQKTYEKATAPEIGLLGGRQRQTVKYEYEFHKEMELEHQAGGRTVTEKMKTWLVVPAATTAIQIKGGIASRRREESKAAIQRASTTPDDAKVGGKKKNNKKMKKKKSWNRFSSSNSSASDSPAAAAAVSAGSMNDAAVPPPPPTRSDGMLQAERVHRSATGPPRSNAGSFSAGLPPGARRSLPPGARRSQK